MWGVDTLAQAGLTPRTLDAMAAAVPRVSDPLRMSDGVGRESTMSTASHSNTLGMSRESIDGGLTVEVLGAGMSILGGRVSQHAGQDAGASSAAAAQYINPYSGVSPRLSAARSPLYSALSLGSKELGGESARRLSTGASPALTATPRTSLLLASLGYGSNGATPRMSGTPGTPTSMSLGVAIMGDCGHDDFGIGSPARGTAAMHDVLRTGMGSMAAPPPRPPSAAAPAAERGSGGDALRTLLGSGLF